MAMLCFFSQVWAQSNSSNKYLTVGDQMPDVQITNVINSNFKSAKISDYKGKIVLLDFWATWCSTCINAFPEMESLQRKFGNEIQVLLVNPKREENTKSAVKFIVDQTSEKMGRPFKLPIVFSDNALTANFDFYSIPHCVWIGRDGKIIAITGKPEVTAENLQKVIAGLPVNFKLKSPNE
jgi:thiol-disulfide isomerase/thioredoxin